MNKKVLKVVSVIAGLSTIISAFSGCKDSKKVTLQNDINKDLPPVTLTFDWPGDKPSDADEVLNQVEEKCKLNIKLKFNYLGSNYSNSIGNMISSSKFDADAFATARSSNQYLDCYQLAQKGYLKDITKLLGKYAPNINKSLSAQDLEANEINGKLYYIPSLYPQTDCVSVAVNQDLMKKYNISSIKNFDDYEAYLKIIKDKEPDFAPGALKISSYCAVEQAFNYVLLDEDLSLVYDYNDPQMKIIPWEQTAAFKKIVDYFTRWNDNSYIVNEHATQKQFASAMISNPVEGPTSVNITNANAVITKMNFYNYPLYTDKPLFRISPVNNTNSGVIAINSNSKNAERVLMFLNWVESSKENYNLFMYGIEGKDYQSTNGTMTLPEGNKIYTSYANWFKVPFMNLNFMQSSQINNTNIDSYRSVIKSKTKYAPHEGFVPNYAKIQDQFNSRVQLVISNILKPLSNGLLYNSNVDSAVKNINDAGTTEPVVTEIQKQLDAWKASKK